MPKWFRWNHKVYDKESYVVKHLMLYLLSGFCQGFVFLHLLNFFHAFIFLEGSFAGNVDRFPTSKVGITANKIALMFRYSN